MKKINHQKKKVNKHIWKVDLAIIVTTVIGLFFLVDYARPLVISPADNLKTTENYVLFSFEKADKILIDDNLDFSSPKEIYVEENVVINLEPGIYYWKVDGILNSEIRKVTIESSVDLKLRRLECNDCYGIFNAGNTRLNVNVYNGSLLTEKIILDIDEEEETKGTK